MGKRIHRTVPLSERSEEARILIKFRAEKKWTQAQLAKYLGISPGYLSGIETATRMRPKKLSADMVSKLSAAGCKIANYANNHDLKSARKPHPPGDLPVEEKKPRLLVETEDPFDLMRSAKSLFDRSLVVFDKEIKETQERIKVLEQALAALMDKRRECLALLAGNTMAHKSSSEQEGTPLVATYIPVVRRPLPHDDALVQESCLSK